MSLLGGVTAMNNPKSRNHKYSRLMHGIEWEEKQKGKASKGKRGCIR